MKGGRHPATGCGLPWHEVRAHNMCRERTADITGSLRGEGLEGDRVRSGKEWLNPHSGLGTPKHVHLSGLTPEDPDAP